jgi:hypothetical protein
MHLIVVFDNQNGFLTSEWWRLHNKSIFLNGWRLLTQTRQAEPNCRAFVEFAVNLDMPAGLLDETIDLRQQQPRDPSRPSSKPSLPSSHSPKLVRFVNRYGENVQANTRDAQRWRSATPSGIIRRTNVRASSIDANGRRQSDHRNSGRCRAAARLVPACYPYPFLRVTRNVGYELESRCPQFEPRNVSGPVTRTMRARCISYRHWLTSIYGRRGP